MGVGSDLTGTNTLPRDNNAGLQLQPQRRFRILASLTGICVLRVRTQLIS